VRLGVVTRVEAIPIGSSPWSGGTFRIMATGVAASKPRSSDSRRLLRSTPWPPTVRGDWPSRVAQGASGLTGQARSGVSSMAGSGTSTGPVVSGTSVTSGSGGSMGLGSSGMVMRAPYPSPKAPNRGYPVETR